MQNDYRIARCCVVMAAMLLSSWGRGYCDSGILGSATIDEERFASFKSRMRTRNLRSEGWQEFLWDNRCTAELCLPELEQVLREHQMYDAGDIWVVLGAIQRIGPRASAASRLISPHLLDDRFDNAGAALRALAAIGPQAKRAAPMVQEYINNRIVEEDVIGECNGYATLIAIDGDDGAASRKLAAAIQDSSKARQVGAVSSLCILQGDRRSIRFIRLLAEIVNAKEVDKDVYELGSEVSRQLRISLHAHDRE